jgi:hypothetical protein
MVGFRVRDLLVPARAQMSPDDVRRCVMEDKTVLRVGAWAAIIGGVLAVLVNILAPRNSGADLGDPAAAVDLATDNGNFEWTSVGVLVALLILLAAFYAITKSIEDVPAKGWARLGLGAVLVATTVGVVLFAINTGLADGADLLGADVAAGVAFVVGGLETGWIITYFGLAALLYGIALTTSDTYPTWLGWITVLSGLVGLVAGFMDFFAGATEASSFILFPVSSGLLTLVVLYIGLLLFRKASAPV